MTGTTHFMAGAAVGRITGNPTLAAVIGFFLHFIMDLVPHWDYGYHFKRSLSSFLIAASDPLIGFLIYLSLGLWRGFSLEEWVVTFVGGFFCALPDVLSVFSKLLKIKGSRPFLNFHNKIHWFIKRDDDVFDFVEIPVTKKGFILGIAYQIPFVLISIWFLIR